ncbi:MAG: MBL fold metallo-hydrolase [Anaerolineales bacterium]|nr:MBL fold metallo-hydrolase [Anaerolineales bacterium]
MKTGTLCLLIETNHGPVLVDTGLGLLDYSHPTAITRLFRIFTVMPFDPAESAIRRLETLGYEPGDVQHIVFSHMHFDHCGGHTPLGDDRLSKGMTYVTYSHRKKIPIMGTWDSGSESPIILASYAKRRQTWQKKRNRSSLRTSNSAFSTCTFYGNCNSKPATKRGWTAWLTPPRACS